MSNFAYLSNGSIYNFKLSENMTNTEDRTPIILPTPPVVVPETPSAPTMTNILSQTTPSNDYLNLAGNLKLAGTIKATNFIKEDGTPLNEITRFGLALPKNVYHVNNKIGVNQENPEADLDISGTLRAGNATLTNINAKSANFTESVNAKSASFTESVNAKSANFTESVNAKSANFSDITRGQYLRYNDAVLKNTAKATTSGGGFALEIDSDGIEGTYMNFKHKGERAAYIQANQSDGNRNLLINPGRNTKVIVGGDRMDFPGGDYWINRDPKGWSAMYLRNNSGQVQLFLNQDQRTDDGGVKTATLRNDAGNLRLQARNSKGIQIDSETGNVTLDSGICIVRDNNGNCKANISSDGDLRIRNINLGGSIIDSLGNNINLNSTSKTEAMMYIELLNGITPGTVSNSDINTISETRMLNISEITDNMDILTLFNKNNPKNLNEAPFINYSINIYFNILPRGGAPKDDIDGINRFTVRADDGVAFEYAYSNVNDKYLNTTVPTARPKDTTGWKDQAATEYTYSIPRQNNNLIIKCKISFYQKGWGSAFTITNLKRAIQSVGDLV
jgi:hypothetical protein